MKPIKLSPIKRMMMFVLSLLVHNVYHTDAFGWTIVSILSYNSCSVRCNAYNNGSGMDVQNMINYHLEFPAYYSHYNTLGGQCLCLTSAELTSLSKCAATNCSLVNSYMSGTRTHVLNSSGNGLTCNQGYSACTCVPGTYVYNRTCSACSPGYYCVGSFTLYSLGINGTRGSATCPSPGTSGTRSSTINSCYVPVNTTGTDTKGAWKYKANCYYAS